jgi:hypothetical protein
MFWGFSIVKVKPGAKVITIESPVDALSVEEWLTLLGCRFRGLEFILLFRQCAILLSNKRASERCCVVLRSGGCMLQWANVAWHC